MDLSSGIGFLPRIEFADGDKILGLVKWQWPQKHRVEHAKDGGIGPDSESERQDNDSCEEWLLGESAKSVTKILHR